jgi:secondary thiamine-phosphate synthase enzyme
MQTQFFEIQLNTNRKIELIDITRKVEIYVSRGAVANGLCIVHAPHATAAIIMNEAESGLISDIERKISKMFEGDYLHDKIDDNAAAHIASAFLKTSVIIPIRDGHMMRGTWQSILFAELDGPRQSRKVIIEIIGDQD